MDAAPRRSFEKYKLVNRDGGSVEASGLGRIDAKDQQNLLWARGVKTDLVVE
jgi:hypothetical protein